MSGSGRRCRYREFRRKSALAPARAHVGPLDPEAADDIVVDFERDSLECRGPHDVSDQLFRLAPTEVVDVQVAAVHRARAGEYAVAGPRAELEREADIYGFKACR